MPTIKELRDRALLTKKVSNEDNENKNSEKYKIFIENVSAIFKIYDLIKEKNILMERLQESNNIINNSNRSRFNGKIPR